MKAVKKIFPIGTMSVGLWFLFNPNISILDPLPDAIGYLLFALALRHVALFVPYMQEALEGFKKLFYITLMKLPALFVMIMLFNDRIAITLFSLSFAILELIFLLPAFRDLFEGFSYLGQRFDCPAAITQTETVKGPDSLRFFTYIFVSAKAVASTLPDFVFLFPYDPLTKEGTSVSGASYFLIVAVLALLVLLLGIFWLSYLRTYFRAIEEDPGLRTLTPPDGVDLTAPKSNFLIALPYLLFGAGIFFSLDLVIDNALILPDYLSGAFFLAAAIYLVVKHPIKGRASLIVSGGYFLSTILFSIFRSQFYGNFKESDIMSPDGVIRIPEAYAAYLPMLLGSFLQEALFFLSVLFLVYLLRDYEKDHLPVPDFKTQYEREWHAQQEKSKRKVDLVIVLLAAATALATFADMYLMRYTGQVVMSPNYEGESVYAPVYGTFWLLPFTLSVVLIVLTIVTCRRRKNEILGIEEE